MIITYQDMIILLLLFYVYFFVICSFRYTFVFLSWVIFFFTYPHWSNILTYAFWHTYYFGLSDFFFLWVYKCDSVRMHQWRISTLGTYSCSWSYFFSIFFFFWDVSKSVGGNGSSGPGSVKNDFVLQYFNFSDIFSFSFLFTSFFSMAFYRFRFYISFFSSILSFFILRYFLFCRVLSFSLLHISYIFSVVFIHSYLYSISTSASYLSHFYNNSFSPAYFYLLISQYFNFYGILSLSFNRVSSSFAMYLSDYFVL